MRGSLGRRVAREEDTAKCKDDPARYGTTKLLAAVSPEDEQTIGMLSNSQNSGSSCNLTGPTGCSVSAIPTDEVGLC